MTREQNITLRLEEIEKALAASWIHAIADQANRRIIVLPFIGDDGADTQILWERVCTAPSIYLTESELLSDDYVGIALRRATGLLAIRAQAV